MWDAAHKKCLFCRPRTDAPDTIFATAILVGGGDGTTLMKLRNWRQNCVTHPDVYKTRHNCPSCSDLTRRYRRSRACVLAPELIMDPYPTWVPP
jgi:hypothetical protein